MEPFLGQVMIFAGNFAPRGWALCEGQILAISQYQALFSLLGTTYGGDGRTSFGLPDLRGRAPISPGSGPGLPTYRWGQKGGQATHILTTLEMPSHSHANTVAMSGEVRVGTSSQGSDTASPDASVLCATTGNIVYNEETPDRSLGGVSSTLSPTVSILNQGGSQAHNNMQPYLAINYIIALQGLFPSRS